jgi:hypothetical protein
MIENYCTSILNGNVSTREDFAQGVEDSIFALVNSEVEELVAA